jgi:hypothetical protein
MRKGRATMDMPNILRALELKLKTLEEVAEAATSRDCQAVAAAKIDYLSALISKASSTPRGAYFRNEVVDELEEAQAHQRLSRNPFVVAGFQVKIGLLESVLRLVDAQLPPPTSKASVRSFLVPA